MINQLKMNSAVRFGPSEEASKYIILNHTLISKSSRGVDAKQQDPISTGCLLHYYSRVINNKWLFLQLAYDANSSNCVC